ncbi:E3 ubiquitin-protein ligase [Morus notabilis]|uniref:RING-type E3 ubiquitin transferase n=1 Tax=Morus notabilis TaxID=981085 RepID=W9QNP2_9ROSA|nr:E3 ubiquitin-protein ligase At3g02290 [Morus notabilis]EXB44880.1 E3 ubiquitin-protein ligase [Morus notabilis]
MDAFCCCFKVQEELEDDINNSNNQHHSSSNGFTDLVSKFATLFRNNETQHVPSRVLACLLTEEAKTKVAKNILEVEECPVCLEEYTTENPKIPMKCSHNYHLACIYEWMERSNFCPICDRVMEFEESLDAQMR